jgi:hypothetical protein
LQVSHTSQQSIPPASILNSSSDLGSGGLSSTNLYPAPPLAHQSQPLTHKAGAVSHQQHTPPAAHHQPRQIQQPLPISVSGSSSATSQILLERLQQQQRRSQPTAVIIESRGAGHSRERTSIEAARMTTVISNRHSTSSSLAADEIGDLRVLSDRPMALATRSVPLLNPPPLAKKIDGNRSGEMDGGAALVNGSRMSGLRQVLTAGPTAANGTTVSAVPTRSTVITDLGPTANRSLPPVPYNEDLNAFCEGKTDSKLFFILLSHH